MSMKIKFFMVFLFYFVLSLYSPADAQTNEIQVKTGEVQIQTLEIKLLSFSEGLNSAEIEFNKAAEYIKKSEYTTAVELLKKSIEYDPGFSKAHYNLGLCYCNLNMDHNAISQFQHAVEKNPNFIEAYHNNVALLYKTGQYKEAVELIEKLAGVCYGLKLYDRSDFYKKLLDELNKKYNSEKTLERSRKYTEKEIKEIMKKLNATTDDVAEVTRYIHKNSTPYSDVESFHLMIVKSKEYPKPLLFLKIQRYNKEMLCVKGYTIKTDNNKFQITLGWNDLVTDFGVNGSSENYTCLINSSNSDMIKAIAGSKKTTVRYQGRQYYDDRVISEKEIKAFQEMVEAFEALGGDLDNMEK